MCNVCISQPDIQYLVEAAKISTGSCHAKFILDVDPLVGVAVAAHNFLGSHWPYNDTVFSTDVL